VRWILRHKLVVGIVALAFAAAAGGGAYAATQSSSNPQTAFLNDLAKRLNVSPQRLTAAMKAAMIDRLNAAAKAGKLSQTQANAIKKRIENGSGPPFLFGPGVGPGGFAPEHGFFFGGPPPFGPLGSAANYLGLNQVQLFQDLRSGRSLAQIAKSRVKSVTGLENAMTAAIKSQLDQTVKAGRLSKSQEQRILGTVTSRLRDFITRARPVPVPAAPWGQPHPLGAPWSGHRAPGPLPAPGF
jgi:hypothetical protein